MGARRPCQAHFQRYQEEEKKPKLDQDGFQQVRHRSGTRRNIFDEVNDDLGRPTWEQRVPNRRLKTKPHS